MDKSKLKRLISLQEGYRQFAYDDATGLSVHGKGKISIGYGRNLEEKGISPIEADMMLDNDIDYFMQQLESKLDFFDKLDEVRKAVLVDMAFNLGIKGLLEFKNMISFMEKKNYIEASKQLLDSDAARHLVKRYNDLAIMLVSGEWVFA